MDIMRVLIEYFPEYEKKLMKFINSISRNWTKHQESTLPIMTISQRILMISCLWALNKSNIQNELT